MPRLELFPFRYRDPRTGKWIRARYVAERHEIATRHTEFEITGPPEIRNVEPDARYFNPHFNVMMNAELRGFSERPPELLATPPAVDAFEAFLVRTFLRRYITYCARRRRFAAMNGAARLWVGLRRLVETWQLTTPAASLFDRPPEVEPNPTCDTASRRFVYRDRSESDCR